MRPTASALARTAPSRLIALVLLVAPGCAVTSHPVTPSPLGASRSSADLLAVIDQPGPVTVETVASADWAVDRSGLINLDAPAAKAAGLKDGDEPIQVYFHALRHPDKGLFLVDTGVERALRDDRGKAAIRGLVASFMHFEKMKFNTPLADWIDKAGQPVRGVMLTHIHLDHISGMADVPSSATVYGGPGDAADSAFLHMFVKGSTDRALEGKGPIAQWQFKPDPAGRFDGVLDVFGDGTVWAIWVPGHTPGSTAYVVRTPTGPVLLTGDACHTRWGWEHDVEPGTFSSDRPRSAASLAKLRKLAAEHPAMDVRFGHQR